MLRHLLGRRKVSGSSNPWELDRRLLAFSKKDFLTIGRSCEGILIMGGTGSGKTSASGRAIALALLSAGYGGIVFTAKGDETRTWEHYCKVTGRSDDLIIFKPEGPWRFGFLDFEARRTGRGAGLSENLVQLLSTIADITHHASGGKGGQEDGQFWEDSKKQLLRNLIDLVLLAKGCIAISDLHEVLSSAPRSIEELQSASWQQQSYCYRCLKEAYQRPKNPIQERDFQVLDRYWMGTFPALAERTRSVIVSSYSAMIDVISRGVLRELFCGETNLTPLALEEGKIIVVDLPVAEYAQVGRYAAAIWKYCAQAALQRREVTAASRPVFLWQDEAQHFVLKTDSMFQSTCRSYKVANILLTQNISNFYATLGGKSSEALVDGLFGNLNLRIFHANGDYATNEWMAKVIGRSRQILTGSSLNYGSADPLDVAMGAPAPQTSASISQVFEYEVQPSVCTTFRTGGPANRYLADSILFSNGACFHATGKPYLFCTFSQK